SPFRNVSLSRNLFRVSTVVEKPSSGQSPSCYGVFGRYILEPGIFDCIENIVPDGGGELQLTDALRLCCEHSTVYALSFVGQHFDVGSRLGYLQAVFAFAAQDPEIGPEFCRDLPERLIGLMKN